MRFGKADQAPAGETAAQDYGEEKEMQRMGRKHGRKKSRHAKRKGRRGGKR
jgi:hypothetical protein